SSTTTAPRSAGAIAGLDCAHKCPLVNKANRHPATAASRLVIKPVGVGRSTTLQRLSLQILLIRRKQNFHWISGALNRAVEIMVVSCRFLFARPCNAMPLKRDELLPAGESAVRVGNELAIESTRRSHRRVDWRLFSVRRQFLLILDAHQSPLLGLVAAVVDEHRCLGLGQVSDAAFVDDFLIIADLPSRPLGLLVYGTRELLGRVRRRVVILSLDDPLFVDFQLNHLVGDRFFSLNHAEHTECQKILARLWTSLLARVCDRCCL